MRLKGYGTDESGAAGKFFGQEVGVPKAGESKSSNRRIGCRRDELGGGGGGVGVRRAIASTGQRVRYRIMFRPRQA